MTTISKPQTQKATRPASRWRNRYRALRRHTDMNFGTRMPGDEDWGAYDWPSRDVAETMGQKCEAENPRWVKYLGAFPVEGA